MLVRDPVRGCLLVGSAPDGSPMALVNCLSGASELETRRKPSRRRAASRERRVVTTCIPSCVLWREMCREGQETENAAAAAVYRVLCTE